MVNNILLNLLKETDPGFKKYLEEKITINRENYDKALMEIYGLSPNSPTSNIIELTEFSTTLWHLLRESHV